MEHSCKKCGASNISIEFMHEGKKIYWSQHNEIKNLSKFTRNDRYYTSDRVSKEFLKSTCKICAYKEAIEPIKKQQ